MEVMALVEHSYHSLLYTDGVELISRVIPIPSIRKAVGGPFKTNTRASSPVVKCRCTAWTMAT
jgi:hypothetical protein